jgi:hypothetical protein
MGKCHEKWTVRVTHSHKRDTKYGFIASPTSEKKISCLKDERIPGRFIF